MLVVREQVPVRVHVPDVLFVGSIDALVDICTEPLGIVVHEVAGAVGGRGALRAAETLTFVHG